MGLSVRERELLILPMGCPYAGADEWKHHGPVGQEFGISDAELDAVRHGRFEAYAARERAQCVLFALTNNVLEVPVEAPLAQLNALAGS